MNIKKHNYDDISEVLYEYEHKCGLKAFVIPKKGYKKIFATFGTHYGSLNNIFIDPDTKKEIRVPDGIAHFLEHKLFEQKDGNVMDTFSKLGANTNAYTGFAETVYLFSCTNNFKDNFNTLLNFVQEPYLTEENVESEKGIIAQEINMLKDSGTRVVFLNLLEGLYKNNPVKIDIGGTVESISKITPELLYKCYNTFYHPSNMMVLVVGDVDPNEVFEIVDKNIQVTDTLDIKRIYPDEPDEVNKKVVRDRKEIARPLFLMGYKDNEVYIDGYDKLKKDVCINLLLDIIMGNSSNLYSDMYSQGLINTTFGYDYTIEENYAFSNFGGETDEPEKVKDMILAEIERIKRDGIKKEDFLREKKSQIGDFIREFERIDTVSTTFIENYFKGVISLDFYRVLEEVTIEDLMYYLKEHFKEERLALSIVYPIER